ncbi:cip1-interacting zinc finger protein isoform X2 [Pseudophryne corroboree]|uniref:cip1-interacting zinc finger protein isoform X2 n=1 Tax=Pseudophryne corroboree TaxID=495146 RepID=UPI00308135DC
MILICDKMFNQQQQQFHQLIQLQHLLQQQQQPSRHPQTAQHQIPAQHAAPRHIPNPGQHQQSQQMMNLQAANPARLLNTHTMLQRALLMQQMQGNLRGLSMVAPPMPQFFSAATRHSILGIPPMGVTVKAQNMSFPPRSFQQPRVYHKDHYKSYDIKRDREQSSSFLGKDTSDTNSVRGNAELPPIASEADETLQDNENLTECSITDPLEPSSKRARSSETLTDEAAEGTTEEADVSEERSVESQSPEGIGGGRALKVTIQRRSESRTTALQPACAEKSGTAGSSTHSGTRFCCYICKTSYQNLQNFQSHLVNAQHQQNIQEIQHLSNACLVTLMPTAKDSQGGMACRDGKKKQMRWCNVCQAHFSCDLIKHRRTPEHKMAKRSLRPFCTVCSRHFKTPRKFVEHMKSPEHKQKSQEVRLREKEPWNPEESEELITVDAVGCFEDEDDEDDEEEEEGISADDISEDTECLPVQKEDSFADHEQGEEYKSDTAYGLDYMVPVAGYLCRLCHKFYPSDSAARLTHCKSLVHFQNVQRCKAVKNRGQLQADHSSKEPQEDEKENQKHAGSVGLESDGTKPTKPEKVQCEKGSIPVAEELGCSSGTNEGSITVFDTVSTSEEDAGYLLEPEVLLAEMEGNLEQNQVTAQEETSCDETSSSCRRSSRHKVR